MYTLLISIVGIISVFALFKYVGKRNIRLHINELNTLREKLIDSHDYSNNIVKQEGVQEITKLLDDYLPKKNI